VTLAAVGGKRLLYLARAPAFLFWATRRARMIGGRAGYFELIDSGFLVEEPLWGPICRKRRLRLEGAAPLG
jgi:hypothetical protein